MNKVLNVRDLSPTPYPLCENEFALLTPASQPREGERRLGKGKALTPNPIKIFNSLQSKVTLAFFFIAILILSMPVLAVEDWGNVYDSYNDAEFGEIISEKEFKDAIKTMEKYNGQKKKKSKKDAPKPVEEPEPPIYEASSSQEPLFMLPIKVDYNGTEINQGFYLANAIERDGNYFIRLTEGEGQVIADIEAKAFSTKNLGKIANHKDNVFFEIVKNKLLKLTYNKRDLILEAYLWIH